MSNHPLLFDFCPSRHRGEVLFRDNLPCRFVISNQKIPGDLEITNWRVLFHPQQGYNALWAKWELPLVNILEVKKVVKKVNDKPSKRSSSISHGLKKVTTLRAKRTSADVPNQIIWARFSSSKGVLKEKKSKVGASKTPKTSWLGSQGVDFLVANTAPKLSKTEATTILKDWLDFGLFKSVTSATNQTGFDPKAQYYFVKDPFAADYVQEIVEVVPAVEVSEPTVEQAPEDDDTLVEILCVDYRRILLFVSHYTAFLTAFPKAAIYPFLEFPSTPEVLTMLTEDGRVYCPERELNRQTKCDTSVWTAYTLPSPLQCGMCSQVILPTGIPIDEQTWKDLCGFREDSKFPAYAWSDSDPISDFYGAIVLRSSRHKLELPSLSMAERLIIDYLYDASCCLYALKNEGPMPKILVVDTGPPSENYKIHPEYCSYISLNLDNESVHEVWKTFGSSCLTATSEELKVFFEKNGGLQGLGLFHLNWIKQLQEMFKTSPCIMIQNGGPKYGCDVLIAALLQVSLEPYYRTKKGFCVLVDKEWVASGYAFAEQFSNFLQFIYCVWILQCQFPNEFEFNEEYLMLYFIRFMDRAFHMSQIESHALEWVNGAADEPVSLHEPIIGERENIRRSRAASVHLEALPAGPRVNGANSSGHSSPPQIPRSAMVVPSQGPVVITPAPASTVPPTVSPSPSKALTSSASRLSTPLAPVQPTQQLTLSAPAASTPPQPKTTPASDNASAPTLRPIPKPSPGQAAHTCPQCKQVVPDRPEYAITIKGIKICRNCAITLQSQMLAKQKLPGRGDSQARDSASREPRDTLAVQNPPAQPPPQTVPNLPAVPTNPQPQLKVNPSEDRGSGSGSGPIHATPDREGLRASSKRPAFPLPILGRSKMTELGKDSKSPTPLPSTTPDSAQSISPGNTWSIPTPPDSSSPRASSPRASSPRASSPRQKSPKSRPNRVTKVDSPRFNERKAEFDWLQPEGENDAVRSGSIWAYMLTAAADPYFHNRYYDPKRRALVPSTLANPWPNYFLPQNLLLRQSDTLNQYFFTPPRFAQANLSLGPGVFLQVPNRLFVYIDLTSLKLDNCSIQHISPFLGGLTKLHVLSLATNGLKYLPHTISALTNLRDLNLRKNDLTLIPYLGSLVSLTSLNLSAQKSLGFIQFKAVQTLTNLQNLDLSENKLVTFPNALTPKHQLQRLVLTNNKLTQIPSSCEHLEAIICDSNPTLNIFPHLTTWTLVTHLDFSHTSVFQIPPSIGSCVRLRTLTAVNCKLTVIPFTIGKCAHLEMIDLSQNKIEYLPVSLGSLSVLRSLIVSENAISQIPVTLASCSTLEIFEMENNPIPPISIQEIRKDAKQLESGEVTLQRVKIFVLGAAKAGCKTVIRYMTEKWEQVANERGLKTNGIFSSTYWNIDPKGKVYNSKKSKKKNDKEFPIANIQRIDPAEDFIIPQQFLFFSNAIFVIAVDLSQPDFFTTIQKALQQLKTTVSHACVHIVGTHCEAIDSDPEKCLSRINLTFREKGSLRHVSISAISKLKKIGTDTMCEKIEALIRARIDDVLPVPYSWKLVLKYILEFCEVEQTDSIVPVSTFNQWASCCGLDPSTIPACLQFWDSHGEIFYSPELFETDQILMDRAVLFSALNLVFTKKARMQFSASGLIQRSTLLAKLDKYVPAFQNYILMMLYKTNLAFEFIDSKDEKKNKEQEALIPAILPEEMPLGIDSVWGDYPLHDQIQYDRFFSFSRTTPNPLVSLVFVRLFRRFVPSFMWAQGFIAKAAEGTSDGLSSAIVTRREHRTVPSRKSQERSEDEKPLTPADIQEKGNALCTAAWTGELDKVIDLLSHPQSDTYVNFPNSRGQTPLYCAARQGFLEIVAKLVNNTECQIDYQVGDHGGTALHAASFAEKPEIVALLIVSGANVLLKNKNGLVARQEAKPDTTGPVFKRFETNGVAGLRAEYPIIEKLLQPTYFNKAYEPEVLKMSIRLELVEKLCSAAWNNRLDEIKYYMGLPGISLVINMPNARGQSALYCSARQGHAQIVLELINYAETNIDIQVQEHGGTPLHAACFAGMDEVVALLIYRGANRQIQSHAGLTPRQEAKGSTAQLYQQFEEQGLQYLVSKFPICASVLATPKKKQAQRKPFVTPLPPPSGIYFSVTTEILFNEWNLILQIRGHPNDKDSIDQIFITLLNLMTSVFLEFPYKHVTYCYDPKTLYGAQNPPELIDFEEVEKLSILGKSDIVHNSNIYAIADIAPDVILHNPCYIDSKDLLLSHEIGQGGYAIVYKGVYKGLQVAVKQLSLGNSDRENHPYEICRREVTIHMKISDPGHPSIAKFLGICAEKFCLVQEYVPGTTLEKFISDLEQPLLFELLLRISVDLALGLKHLHGLKPTIVHRDFKSPNVMINSFVDGKGPTVKIIDFGTSVELLPGEFIEGRVVDNPMWLAPEIVTRKPYTEAVDTYAYGMVLWELAARDTPFSETSFMQDVADAVERGDRPAIPHFVSRNFSKVIKKCWGQVPKSRPHFDWVLKHLDSSKFTPENHTSFNTGQQELLDTKRGLVPASDVAKRDFDRAVNTKRKQWELEVTPHPVPKKMIKKPNLLPDWKLITENKNAFATFSLYLNETHPHLCTSLALFYDIKAPKPISFTEKNAAIAIGALYLGLGENQVTVPELTVPKQLRFTILLALVDPPDLNLSCFNPILQTLEAVLVPLYTGQTFLDFVAAEDRHSATLK